MFSLTMQDVSLVESVNAQVPSKSNVLYFLLCTHTSFIDFVKNICISVLWKPCIVFKISMIWWQRGATVSTSIFAYRTTPDDDNQSNSVEVNSIMFQVQMCFKNSFLVRAFWVIMNKEDSYHVRWFIRIYNNKYQVL